MSAGHSSCGAPATRVFFRTVRRTPDRAGSFRGLRRRLPSRKASPDPAAAGFFRCFRGLCGRGRLPMSASRWPGSVLFGPIFSGPDDRADLVNCLQHRKMKYFLAHAFVLRNRWRSPNATDVQTEVGHSGGSGSVKHLSMFPLCSESALCYAKNETVRRAVGAEIRDRMDGRDLESGDRMHEGRPRLRQLLCRAVRGTMARRSRSSVRAGLRPEALAGAAAQIANGYGSGATRSATAPATFSSAPVTACKSSKEISASFSRRTNRASSMSMTARDV